MFCIIKRKLSLGVPNIICCSLGINISKLMMIGLRFDHHHHHPTLKKQKTKQPNFCSLLLTFAINSQWQATIALSILPSSVDRCLMIQGHFLNNGNVIWNFSTILSRSFFPNITEINLLIHNAGYNPRK